MTPVVRAASFTATVVDVAGLLEAILPSRVGALPPGWARTLRVAVERGADWPSPRLVTRVALGPPLVVTAERVACVEPSGAGTAVASAANARARDANTPEIDWPITLSLETLDRLFFGIDTADAALAAGAVVVHPAAHVADALTFLRLIRLGAPWYSPLAHAR